MDHGSDRYARYTRLKFDRPHAKVLRITMENGRMNSTDAAMHRGAWRRSGAISTPIRASMR